MKSHQIVKCEVTLDHGWEVTPVAMWWDCPTRLQMRSQAGSIVVRQLHPWSVVVTPAALITEVLYAQKWCGRKAGRE